MLLEKYTVIWDAQQGLYSFTSAGPKGSIRKVIRYERIGGNLFNLGFGDWNDERQAIDDSARTNNNDKDKVLATVASTIIAFLYKEPAAQIFFRGSTLARTRLYQMGITANWDMASKLVTVLGIANGKAETFVTGKNYEAFVVQAKRVF